MLDDYPAIGAILGVVLGYAIAMIQILLAKKVFSQKWADKIVKEAFDEIEEKHGRKES